MTVAESDHAPSQRLFRMGKKKKGQRRDAFGMLLELQSNYKRNAKYEEV